MARSFVDRFLTFMGIQEEPVETVEPAPAPERERVPLREEAARDNRRSPESAAVEEKAAETQEMKMVVFHPRVFDDVQAIAAVLKEGKAVVVALDSCGRDVAQRVIDFVSGATYTLDGYMRRLGDDIFLFTPSNVSIDEAEEMEDRLRQEGQARQKKAAQRRRGYEGPEDA